MNLVIAANAAYLIGKAPPEPRVCCYDAVVGAYCPVTGNHTRRLCGSMPRDDVGPRKYVVAHSVPPFRCTGTGAGESPPV